LTSIILMLHAAYGHILMWRDEVKLDPDPKMPEG
jgi:hypothetical protein